MGKRAALNSKSAIRERRAAGLLAWFGPAMMLFARSAFAVTAQGLVAAIYMAKGSLTPWRDAGSWLPVYGTLIDAGCIGLLCWLTRREHITPLDLTGFDGKRLGRDVLIGLALIPPSLLFILGGNSAAGLLVYGDMSAPQIFAPLPLWPALYAVLIFPLVWGVTEQMTYNGYVLPRLQAQLGNTAFAVAVVALFWSAQHAFMPLTFDPDFMLYRLLSPIPHSLFVTLVYLRIRRIAPLATAHWLMDGGAAFAATLWPLMQ